MKKIKIMLLSLALFAVVGGALAFKAKFNTPFCTGVAVGDDNSNEFCPNKLIKSTYGSQGIFVATTTYDGNDCLTPLLKCTTTARTITKD